MGRSFSATVARIGNRALVTCEGELDVDSAEQLRAAVEEALAVGPLGLHVDCSRVSFIDSIGIRALMHPMELCRHRGTRRITVTKSEPMQRLLDTLGEVPRISVAP